MPLRTRTTVVLLACSAFTVGATVAAGWSASATMAKPAAFTACADAMGRLQLQSVKGLCPKGSRKVTLGARGATGARGPKGASGTTGPTGLPGAAGADGHSVLSGSSAPGALTPGRPGDFYLDTSSHQLYGPVIRTCSGMLCANHWGTPVSLIGPTGSQGPIGPPGSQDLAVTSAHVDQVPAPYNSFSVVLSLPVVAGHTYLIQVAGEFFDEGYASRAECVLDYASGGKVVALPASGGLADMAGAGYIAPFTMSATLASPLSGGVELQCESHESTVRATATMTALALATH